MAVEELDTEQFLDEVKKYPELWDIARKEYTKSNKAQTWLKICEVFNEDFDKKSEEEKQLISKYAYDICAGIYVYIGHKGYSIGYVCTCLRNNNRVRIAMERRMRGRLGCVLNTHA